MTLYVGMESPHQLVVVVTRSDSTPDLSGTTSADIVVSRSDGTIATWAAQSVTSVSASGYTVTRTLATGDLPSEGIYRLYTVANPSGWESANVTFTVERR